MTQPAPRWPLLNPVRLYRTFWQYSVEDRPAVIAFMAMLIGAQAIRLAIPYFAGLAVETMQSESADALRAAGWDIALIFVISAASWVLQGPARIIERLVGLRVEQRFADRLYATAATLPLAWHEHHHSGETVENVRKSTAALGHFAQNQFIYLQNAVSVIGPVAALFLISAPVGLAMLVGYTLIGIVLIRFDSALIRFTREQNRAHARYAAAFVDCLGNIETVSTLRLQEPTRRLLAARLAAVTVPFRNSVMVNEAKWSVVDVFNSGIRCGLVALYVWLAWRHGVSPLLGGAVMVYQYAQQAGDVVTNMAAHYNSLVVYQTDLAAADHVLAGARPHADEASVPPGWRDIRVKALQFTYASPRCQGPTLADITLRLRRGARVALIGENGSGKSTLLRVLAGLYPADNVRFFVDDRPLPTLGDLGSIALLAPQSPEIFEGTIAHNLTFGIDRDPVAVRRACDVAQFTGVVAALPDGLATNIAERGLNFSGGQKQRLALARALLAAEGRSLLLFDEPTSNLDPASEAQVYDNLFAAFPDACILSSLHRLHLLDRFDEIVLMKDGRIADSGAPADLLARSPLLRDLYRRYGGAAQAAASLDLAEPSA